jgi:hypothetical protein
MDLVISRKRIAVFWTDESPSARIRRVALLACSAVAFDSQQPEWGGVTGGNSGAQVVSAGGETGVSTDLFSVRITRSTRRDSFRQ